MELMLKSFKESLFTGVSDLSIDFCEMGIGSLIENITENEILKKIPIVKTICTVGKVTQNMHNRNLLKQTLIFINEFNSGEINNDKLIAYRSTINNNPKKAEEELGRVLILLNSHMDVEKSKILARLFKSYIYEKIDWSKFCEYSEITNRIFIQDIPLLFEIEKNNIIAPKNYKISRLSAIGLVVTAFDVEDESLFQEWKNSEIGKEYIEIIGNIGNEI